MSKPLACWICGKTVNLNDCKTDERGQPVHEECYVARLTMQSSCGSSKPSAPRETYPLNMVRWGFRGESLFFVLPMIESPQQQTDARLSEEQKSDEEEIKIYAAPHRNGGAARPAEGSSESCFRGLGELRSADPLACPWRAPNAYGPYGSSAHILTSAASDGAHSR